MFRLDFNPIDFAREQKLRVVILEAPYDTYQSAETRNLLSSTAALKLAGYQKEYPYGVLPIDTTDFFANHMLLCRENGSSLTPVMGMKTVSLLRCQLHNMKLPVFNLINGQDLPLHLRAMERILESAMLSNQEVGYNGSWTIDPLVRQDKDLKQFARALTVSWFVHYYREYGIPNVFAGATLRFKVEQWKEFLGFEYLQSEGQSLPSIDCKPFFSERVAIMCLRKVRPEADLWARAFLPLWKSRLTVGHAVDVRELLARKAA